MERRDFIAGGCAVPLALGAGIAPAREELTVEVSVKDTAEVQDLITELQDKYWQAQAHIDALELELQEMRHHEAAQRINHEMFRGQKPI